MKKILPYILIALIFANLFAPISVHVDNNYRVNVVNNTASAAPDPQTPTTIDPQNEKANPTLACGWSTSTWFHGCIAQAFYYVFFVPTSFMFGLAGKFFDWTFAYSISDTSYKSAFVVQGWGIVRDFCNMFFIFVLLYIAFATILNLHGFKTKEMIINVVIIGILINFSLFATQVIIDSSNILARVFYNSNTISMPVPKDTNIKVSAIKIGEDGVIPMSEIIVNKINPQSLLFHTEEVGAIPDLSGKTQEDKEPVGAWTFILVTILATAVNVVGFIVFLSVGFIFVVRVIGLWLAMIFVPMAFFSYTVPAMQDIDFIGWKKWWPETLKLAFLAPIFIFFLYLIVKFISLESFFPVGEIVNKKGIAFIITVIVPFMFIMVLLMKAKSIATKFSGTLGEMASKVGSAVSGIALGVATGGASMAMTGTIGRAGNAIANSETLKAREAKGGPLGFGARMLRNIGNTAGKGSFDVRATKLGVSAGKSLGVDLGKAKEGGFAKMRADKVAYRQKRAKELEVGEDSKLRQDMYTKQNILDKAKSDPTRQANIAGYTKDVAVAEKDVALADREVVKSERQLKDAIDKFGAKSAASDTARTNRDSVVSARDNKVANLDTAKNNLKVAEQPIKDAEKELKTSENTIIGQNRQRRENYAKTIQGGWSNTINLIVSGGQHAVKGEREAANKILVGIEKEKK